MSSVSDVIKTLEEGICPIELCFNNMATEAIDWDKVRYNTFGKTRDFYKAKFPECMHDIPGFEQIIDLMVENNKDTTPLEEIKKLSK